MKRSNAIRCKEGGDFGDQLKMLKKEHQIKMITLKKGARKAQIEFFKKNSEQVMRVFKQEQMYMVEEFYNLK